MQFLRALSPPVEFAVVILGAFGLFIFSSLYEVVDPSPATLPVDADLVFLLVHESIVLAALGAFLHLRGWRLGHLGLRPDAMGTLIGIGLAIGCYVAMVVGWLTAMTLLQQDWQEPAALAGGGLSLLPILLVSLVNPVFEEVFVCGYVVTVVKQRSDLRTAVEVSVAIRLLYHLYQGTTGIAGILPIGIILSYWYARTGRLWPVVVAHALLDLATLLPLRATLPGP